MIFLMFNHHKYSLSNNLKLALICHSSTMVLLALLALIFDTNFLAVAK